jgi:polar amino acid transport system substrate-binding protein
MLGLLTDRKSGEVGTYDIPAPELRPGGILVRTHFSAISAGTERATLELSSKSLIQKAMARPELARQVIDYARQNGIKAAYQRVQSKLETLTTMGYSCAGEVIAVAGDVTEFRPGDLVACAGGGFANHCEINFVPRNLAVRIPEGVSTAAAALTTIGAIAMQGLRQANIAVGETIAVIGAGLVGVLTVQIARAAGCRVVAIDLNPKRVQAAATFGAHLAIAADDPTLGSSVLEFSRYGVDAAILTAASESAEPAELAAKLLRDRGRMVVVGAVGMGVSRGNMYMKELSLSLSRSYGPGRYDPRYEEQGVDYPIGYVRWTEQRNMEAFLDLLASRQIDVERLIENRYPASEGGRAYAELKNGAYTALIDYAAGTASSPKSREISSVARPAVAGEIRAACIGAGSFATGTIIPILQSLNGVRLESVATISGTGAVSAQRAFKFSRAQQPSEVIADPNIDIAFVVTRHDAHAEYVRQAIRAGKPIFVEKPLATTPEQLAELREAHAAEIRAGRSPFVMAGFNRRFAPFSVKIQQFFSTHREPMMVHARINAGYIPRDHWIHQDGGRIVGEFCHFVDWARAVVGAPIERVAASALPDGARYRSDNLAVTLTFADGSIANLLYVANGDGSLGKEFFEVFCQGKVARLDNFRTLELGSGGKLQHFKSTSDKGHRRELELTIEALGNGKPAPIPFDELAEVTETTFLVQQAIASGEVLRLGRANAAVPAASAQNISLSA